MHLGELIIIIIIKPPHGPLAYTKKQGNLIFPCRQYLKLCLESILKKINFLFSYFKFIYFLCFKIILIY